MADDSSGSRGIPWKDFEALSRRIDDTNTALSRRIEQVDSARITHEAVCGERYGSLLAGQDRLSQQIRMVAYLIAGLAFATLGGGHIPEIIKLFIPK